MSDSCIYVYKVSGCVCRIHVITDHLRLWDGWHWQWFWRCPAQWKWWHWSRNWWLSEMGIILVIEKVMVFFIWDKMAIMLYRQTHFTFANFVLFPLCICWSTDRTYISPAVCSYQKMWRESRFWTCWLVDQQTDRSSLISPNTKMWLESRFSVSDGFCGLVDQQTDCQNTKMWPEFRF